MEPQTFNELPTQCPSCGSTLAITRMTCISCGTEVSGSFSLSRLASLREPHASLLELFLRVRGNVKDMEKILGLSYPTVRKRLEEAFEAAGLEEEEPPLSAAELTRRRAAILEDLEQERITPADAAAKLRELRGGK